MVYLYHHIVVFIRYNELMVIVMLDKMLYIILSDEILFYTFICVFTIVVFMFCFIVKGPTYGYL